MREGGAGPHAAVYHARYEPAPGERARKFRAWIHAAEPDRLHGEILSAVGTTELILDAGAGQVSIFFVRDRVAFVGPADEGALDALLGLPVRVAELVEALRGTPPRDSALQWTLRPVGTVYPDSILLQAGERRLELRLKHVRAMRADPAGLGTGRPPAGTRQRPLSELDPEAIPGVEVEPGGSP